MGKKIKEIAERIANLKEARVAYKVDVHGHRGQQDECRSQSSSFPPSFVYGRYNDQERVVKMLLESDLKPNVAVLPIHGDPCVGKTTVTQLVFNDDRVSTNFELKLWVHVPHEFNIKRVTASIIESIEGIPFHSDSLNTLQTRLEKLLLGTRYLLVLDDYWTENWRDWENLKLPLLKGASGSKIIITTRSVVVAKDLGTMGPYHLQRLEKEDCWSLFCHHALVGTEIHAYNFPDERLKEEVLQKCKGLPFIAVLLGHRLHQENDIGKWTIILSEQNWDSTGHLIGGLRLSYAQLGSHLKPCFAYSSIIPRNFQFEEEWLIQHWIAQGFIQPNPSTGETIEDSGRSYFRSLVSQSFFQRANVGRTGQGHSYSLSEMMQDLVSHVSDEDCKCFVIEGPYSLPKKVRYLTLIFKKPTSQAPFEMISGGEHLYTLVVVGGSEDFVLKIPKDIGKKFTRLRTLDLSNFSVTELPKSVGKMKSLRCLQLQSSKIRQLPKSICDLYNLQILGLSNCYYLEELPHKIKNLRKLRHIDLAMTCHTLCRLRCMPKHIGLLTDLQTLSRFVISHTGRGGIAELAKLNNLHGELLISNLDLIKDVQEAARANLASKQFLQKLHLSWSEKNKQAEQILEHLKPPTNIKELTISGYTGMACPIWLSSPEYKNLVKLRLYNFKDSSVLPPLDRLPLLENLHLKSWERLVSIDCREICRTSTACFRSLKKLHLEKMDRLQHWEGDERCVFPSLLELVIENCCILEQVTQSFPSLTKIAVEGSPALRGLRNFPSLKCVDVKASGDWIWGSWRSLSSSISITLCQLPTTHFPSGLGQFHTSLQHLEISHCEQLVSIPDDWPPCNLIHFSVKHCPQLQKLPSGIQRLRGLEDMEIIDCGKLSCLPEMNGLISLIRLEIVGCNSIQSLPYTGFPSSMQVLSINRCQQLELSCTVGTDRAKTEKIFSVWINGCEVSTSAQHSQSSLCCPSNLH